MHRAWTFDWRAKGKCTNSERILGSKGEDGPGADLLLSCTQTRARETVAAQQLPAHTLMERAGLAVARFALAVAPHARSIWIACGPGNNGGDGFEAATHLKRWGKSPVITILGGTDKLPVDAATSRQKAIEAGVTFSQTPPPQYDLCIDALFGIGQLRPWSDTCSQWIAQFNARMAPVLAVDIPSGLDADTGTTRNLHVKADYTLSLLSLKPGLFTADGRDACGEIWFDDLGIPATNQACAQLNSAPDKTLRAHNTHKGSYGDVCIVGGAPGMSGAATLATRAALRGGAGRVYSCLLDPAAMRLDICQPELMFRDLSSIDCGAMVVVAGCGGGQAIREHLQQLLTTSGQLVLDADALNAIAQDAALQDLLAARRPLTTVLTPHPLEAARLLHTSTTEVQSNRLAAAQAIAERFACVVVLKGSGTIIAAPQALPRINPTGNARLATAGTGDVLAGLIGATLAGGSDAWAAACAAVFRHGRVADHWTGTATMTAQDLAQAL